MAGSVNLSDVLVAPIGDLVRQVCSAIGAAQVELDNASLRTQRELATTHPDLAAAGYQVTWYTMPEVAVELKLAVHYEETNSPSGSSGSSGSPGPAKTKGRLLAAPFNAKYQNAFQYKADGSSSLKLRVIPIPPPAALTST